MKLNKRNDNGWEEYLSDYFIWHGQRRARYFSILCGNPCSVSAAHSILYKWQESYLAVPFEAITGENKAFQLSVWPQ